MRQSNCWFASRGLGVRGRFAAVFAISSALLITPQACSQPQQDGPHESSVAARAAPLTNGTPITDASTYGWAAFVRVTLRNNTTIISCSGSLVAPDTVLTAAHCLVCGTSATVSLVASEQVYQSAPNGLLVNPLIPQVSDDICNSSDVDGSLSEFLAANSLYGADLAVIKLTEPSTRSPAPLLFHPPYGFSPVQKLPPQTNLWAVGGMGRSPSA